MVRKQTPTETTAATETADTPEITSATVADTTPASKPKRSRAASAAKTDKTEGKTTSKPRAAASKKVVRKKSAPIQVLAAASEIYPLIKTGGLADVVGALPLALESQGVHVKTLVPGYPRVMQALHELSGDDAPKLWLETHGFFWGDARLWSATVHGMDLLVLDAPHLYARDGNPYLDHEGNDWWDNPTRFAALSLMAAQLSWGAYEHIDYRPDVLHVHDWQTALAPTYLHYLGAGKHRPKTVITIHNLAFQGQYSAHMFGFLGLPGHAFSTEGVEYYGGVGFLKAGILFSDQITTVSPSYAQEITTIGGGMGLDGLLRSRGSALSGIVNGIDTDIWNPAKDPALAANYTASKLKQRKINKEAVEKHFNIPHSDAPLLCVISRLTWQKGVDLLIQSLDAIVAMDVRVVVLGSGDPGMEAALYAAHHKHPTHVAVHTGYDEQLSHLMQGGCDGILVPSRFEPCGLTQLYGLRYGCVPIVTRVGGLNDTVVDANHAAVSAGVATGIQCHDVSAEGIIHAVARFNQLYAQPKLWQGIQKAGMATDVGWTQSALAYKNLF